MSGWAKVCRGWIPFALAIAPPSSSSSRAEPRPAPVITEFPDIVLVGDSAHFWCSGVALTPTWVVTAAHCARATHVGLGTDAATARPVRIVGVRRHPTADVALLALDTAISTTFHPRRSGANPPLGEVAIVGFGVRDQVDFADFGRKHVVRVTIDGWGCDAGRSVPLGCASDTELLIQGGHGNDTCFGDSGGGVFEATRRAWRLIGITSRGTTPKRTLCGEGGVYVRFDKLEAWFGEEMSR